MRRFLLVMVLLLSAVGCMNNRWGLLYDGRYSSTGQVQAFADKHGLTYEEAFRQLHSDEQEMWGEIVERQQRGQHQPPPANATEAQQIDPVF